MMPLPAPGTMLAPSAAYVPALIRGVMPDPANPLKFNFIVDTGNDQLSDEALRIESNKLIKYFLASLTVPESELWVNLSPYEKERVIPEGLGATEMGRDLLAQDYLLKQLAASLMYPENELGKDFWKRMHKKARDISGSDISTETFNKVWVIPQRAVVVEHQGGAFVVESHLKVMLDEDYLALAENNHGVRDESLDGVSQIMREMIVPQIEKEVNEGRTFANLRQIYHSMILATWYKKRLNEGLLSSIYVDQNKIKGIDLEDKQARQKIYAQYLEAFKKGVYDYIKEDYDSASKDFVPRKYFSGGVIAPKEINIIDPAMLTQEQRSRLSSSGRVHQVSVALLGADGTLAEELQYAPYVGLQGTDPAMLLEDYVLFIHRMIFETGEIQRQLRSPTLTKKNLQDFRRILVADRVRLMQEMPEGFETSASGLRVQERFYNKASTDRKSNNEYLREADAAAELTINTISRILLVDRAELSPETFRILLVDDHKGMRQTVLGEIKKEGFTNITDVASAEAALALLEEQEFDLVISDISMPPGMDGVKFSAELYRRFPELDVILMSTDSQLLAMLTDVVTKNVKRAVDKLKVISIVSDVAREIIDRRSDAAMAALKKPRVGDIVALSYATAQGSVDLKGTIERLPDEVESIFSIIDAGGESHLVPSVAIEEIAAGERLDPAKAPSRTSALPENSGTIYARYAAESQWNMRSIRHSMAYIDFDKLNERSVIMAVSSGSGIAERIFFEELRSKRPGLKIKKLIVLDIDMAWARQLMEYNMVDLKEFEGELVDRIEYFIMKDKGNGNYASPVELGIVNEGEVQLITNFHAIHLFHPQHISTLANDAAFALSEDGQFIIGSGGIHDQRPDGQIGIDTLFERIRRQGLRELLSQLNILAAIGYPVDSIIDEVQRSVSGQPSGWVSKILSQTFPQPALISQITELQQEQGIDSQHSFHSHPLEKEDFRFFLTKIEALVNGGIFPELMLFKLELALFYLKSGKNLSSPEIVRLGEDANRILSALEQSALQEKLGDLIDRLKGLRDSVVRSTYDKLWDEAGGFTQSWSNFSGKKQATPAPKPQKVLLVEDNEDILDLFVMLLQYQGYEVFGAPDINVAREILAREPIAFVLSDIRDRSGVETGIDLAARLVTDFPNVKFGLMSGYYEGPISELIKRSPQYFGILTKPIDDEHLVRVVNKAIGPAVKTSLDRAQAADKEILVVDDNESIRISTGRLLRAAGFKYSLAVNGKEALELIRSEPQRFGGVISDNNMPEMNGIELISRLKDEFPDLPVILASADFDIEAKVARRNLTNLRRIVPKPFDADQLLETVRGFFDQSEKQQEPGDLAMLQPEARQARTITTHNGQRSSSRVLIVDDNPKVRTEVAGILGDRGYEVVAAESGYRALEILQESQGDFVGVVTDNNMPIMDGETLLDIMADEFPELTAIMFSGDRNIMNRRASVLQSHPNLLSILTKQNDFEELGNAVEYEFGAPEMDEAMASDPENIRITREFYTKALEAEKSKLERAKVANDAASIRIFSENILFIENELKRLKPGGSEPAMAAPGGIDLNPALLDLQIKFDPDGRAFPIEQQPIMNMDIEGFVPVIINITPVQSLPQLFGWQTGETRDFSLSKV